MKVLVFPCLLAISILAGSPQTDVSPSSAPAPVVSTPTRTTSPDLVATPSRSRLVTSGEQGALTPAPASHR